MTTKIYICYSKTGGNNNKQEKKQRYVSERREREVRVIDW